MRLLRLQLFDYRNFRRLDLALPSRPAVFVGDNAQGKTNLLEAIYLLATMRGLRAQTDIQLIGRDCLDGETAIARVLAQVDTAEGPLKLEVGIVGRSGAHGPVATKVARVNGVSRRLSSAVGRLMAVLFTAEDLSLIGGSPSLRRRYLDITLAQVEQPYAAARQRFERVLLQRNHLLKKMREGGASPDELSFWDGELAKDGGLIFQRRAAAVRELDGLARAAHASLAPGETLELGYLPRMEDGGHEIAAADERVAADAYASALRQGLRRDIAAGMTLQGPHRDDLLFSLDGFAAAGYASRAQQRTIALSLRLAEARLLWARRGEPPVLLLDDVLSEMDAGRRRSVLAAVRDYEQILMTGTEFDRFPLELLDDPAIFEVESGSVRPLPAALASRRTGESEAPAGRSSTEPPAPP